MKAIQLSQLPPSAIERESMRTLTIDERVDRITERIRHRSAEATYGQCGQRAKRFCPDALQCTHCDATSREVSCGDSWDAHSDWSDYEGAHRE
jgi:hypothetical protein